MGVVGAELKGIEPAQIAPVALQLGKLANVVDTASHLPPDTVTGVPKLTVIVPVELSVKAAEPIRVVGAVPNPLSS